MIQAYSVKSPSKKFKKLFPKKYTLVKINLNEQKMNECSGMCALLNVSRLSEEMFYDMRGMYLFTYDTKLPKMCAKWFKELEEFEKSEIEYIEKVGNVQPWGLLDYIYDRNEVVGDKENKNKPCTHTVNCVLRVIPGMNEVPPTFTEPIVVRCNSEEMLGRKKGMKNIPDNVLSNNVRRNTLKVVNGYLNSVLNDYDVETFLMKVCYGNAWNDFGYPFVYPKIIENKTLKDMSCLSKNDALMICYDIIGDTPEQENDFIHALDDAFENENIKITVFQNYNRRVDRLIKEFKERKIKYKVMKKFAEEVLAIQCKLKDVKSVNGWLITDMIA